MTTLLQLKLYSVVVVHILTATEWNLSGATTVKVVTNVTMKKVVDKQY